MTTASFLLEHRPDLGVLVLRWLRQPSEAELQTGYLQALAEAEAHSCRY